MELELIDEIGSRKTREIEGILGKGIKAEEGREVCEAKGKTFSWKITSLEMKIK